EEYSDGVWLVELAPLADSALVPAAVAASLGVRERPGRPLLETLVRSLEPRTLLLVLDNGEHLVGACADLAQTLLTTCRGLRILATSREPLRVPGEATWRVPSLAVPEIGRLASPDDVAAYAAVRLFVERARAVRPGFCLTSTNAAAITEVCARLDGLPLAVELAAACLAALTIEQVVARLGDAFRLLTR